MTIGDWREKSKRTAVIQADHNGQLKPERGKEMEQLRTRAVEGDGAAENQGDGRRWSS